MKTKTRKDKRAYIIIALVVALLLLAVGYAAFSQTLNVTGNVTGTVSYDVHFDNASTGGSAAITNSGHTLTANVTLANPGDAQEVTAVIQNDSSIPVKITSFNFDDSNDSSDNLTFTYENLDSSEVIAAGGTCTYKFAIKWNEASTATSVNGSYAITFNYVQGTTENATASASHSNS